ncbi:Single-stranded DNA-binding protein [Rickettsiales bacterium Ac37b]|nr:Single-stranded DNA-binding protein [Rickettsiales bacterium Ac37b]
MVGSINKAILIGNVGRDPEIRVTQNGQKIANIALATSETWRDKSSGERREKTEWHRIVIFSEGLVNIVEQYIKKGTKLYIEGAIQTRKWVDNSGVERYYTEIILQGYNSNLMILDTRNSNNNDYANNSSEATYSKNNNEHSKSFNDDLEDEIPF